MVLEKLPFRFWGNWFTLKLWKKHWNEFQANTLYATDSYVVSLAVNQNGTGFLSGHADGSIIRWYVADDTSARSQVRIPEVTNLLIATYCRMMLFRSQFIKNSKITNFGCHCPDTSEILLYHSFGLQGQGFGPLHTSLCVGLAIQPHRGGRMRQEDRLLLSR